MKNDSKFIRAPEEISNIKEINFFWEGKPYVGKEGDTIASALLACWIGYKRHS